MELILIRHGLPEKVIRSDGGAADPNLSEQGHRQAAQKKKKKKKKKIYRPTYPIFFRHETGNTTFIFFGLTSVIF